MITSFTGRHRWLSNFYQSMVDLDGDLYLTVEHAYQAAKTEDLKARRGIRSANSPGEARRMGRRLQCRPDWDDVKISIMEDLLRQKFSRSPLLGRLLISTGELELVEGNNWGDKFWGVSDGVGENHLGRLIMKIREEIR